MKNRKNIAVFTFLAIGLFCLNSIAQIQEVIKPEPAKPICTGKPFIMPLSIAAGNEVLADYMKIASLTRKTRADAFSKQSNEKKANFVKMQYVMMLVKRPQMTKEQQSFILDLISKISPDIYDRTNPEKQEFNKQLRLDAEQMERNALGLFAGSDLSDILEPLFASKEEDILLLQKYENLLNKGMRSRKGIVKLMPATERVNIWKTQLAYHFATGKFSKAQKDFLLDMIIFLTPEIFTPRANLTKEAEEALDTLEAKVFKVFSVEEAYAIFMTIGIQKIVNDEPESFTTVSTQKNVKGLSVTNLMQWSCDCRWSCPEGQTCGGTGCMETSSGCGVLDLFACTNACKKVKNPGDEIETVVN